MRVRKFTFRSLNKNTFPILCYVSPYTDYLSYKLGCCKENEYPCGDNANYKTFKDLKECGFNIMVDIYTKASINLKEQERIINVLSLAEQLNIGVLVATENGTSNNLFTPYMINKENKFDDVISPLFKFNSFLGLQGVDEPGIYEMIAHKFKTNKEIHNAISIKENKKVLTSKWEKYKKNNKINGNVVYFQTLLPILALKSQFRGNINRYKKTKPIIKDILSIPYPSYETYLDTYIKYIKPKFLIYDNYPLRTNKPVLYSKNKYFENLYIVSKKCKENNIPFIGYADTTEWSNGDNRVPNFYELMYCVYTNILYGSKGIAYFTYAKPNFNSDPVFKTSKGCLINLDGNKTELYDYAKLINSHIKRMEKILMNSEIINLYKIGNDIKDENGKEINLKGFKKFNKDKNILKIINSHSILFNLSSYKDKEFYFVLNNNLEKENNIKIIFKRNIKTKNIGLLKSFNFNGNILDLKLLPGESCLILLNE